LKKTSVILAVVIAALFVLALFPSFASAAGGISVSPAVYDQAVTNGQQLKPITVVNSGSATERVTVGIVGVGQDVKQGSVLLTDQATVSGLEACFEITPRDFELPPCRRSPHPGCMTVLERHHRHPLLTARSSR